jgi:hypothetical protein
MYDGWSFLAATWLTASIVRGSLLSLLSMLLWVCMENVEHLEIYLAAGRHSRGFLRNSRNFIAKGDYDGVLTLAASRSRSHIAAVFAGGLRQYLGA